MADSLPLNAPSMPHSATAAALMKRRPANMLGRQRRRRLLAWLTIAASLVGLFAVSIAAGSVAIPLADAVRILFGGEASRESWRMIILNVRLPKAITATLAGGALAISGAIMQTLFRNPLADPFTLGISSGASLGAAIVLLAAGTVGASLVTGLGLLGDLGVIAAASAGAALVCGAVVVLARRVRSVLTLLILGLMFGYMAGAAVSILAHFSIAERLQAYVNWANGSFGGVTWSQLPVFAAAIAAGVMVCFGLIKPLNAWLLGEDYAASMGVSVKRARTGLILGASILAGTVTAFCGPIGFLGVAVPHLARSAFRTADHRVILPASVVLGGALGLAADLATRLPGDGVGLPLNAVTALLGAPVVIAMILRRRS